MEEQDVIQKVSDEGYRKLMADYVALCKISQDIIKHWSIINTKDMYKLSAMNILVKRLKEALNDK